MCSRVPVIVILGATGSGKSKLGIEIARKFGGEILSADSMQAYKGLDIITNKVTDEEREQAPHHLLDVVTPPRPFSVVEFRDAALPIVERLLREQKVPVVVGGTNYYIESLLWKVLVSPGPDLLLPEAAPTSEDEGAASQDEGGGGGAEPETAREEEERSGGTPPDAAAGKETETSRKQERGTVVVGGEASGTDGRGVDRVDAVDPDAFAGGGEGDDAAGGGPGDAASRPEAPDTRPRAASVADPLLADEPLLKKARLDPEVEALPSPELHRRLQQVDPDMARRLHPNNRRRIIRSLQVYEQLGRAHSDILREQIQGEGGGALGGPLRYPHSAIFWLRCDQATLNARLDGRVDEMLRRGLVAELLDFHARYNAERIAENKEADYTKGIFQSIGFKEFHEYLLLPEAERESARGQRMFREAVTALKMVTRRYARKQVRWIVNRFLRQPTRQVPPVYAFDTSDPSKWDELVYKPAVHVVQSLLNGDVPIDLKPLPLEEPLSNELTSFHCEVCDRVFIGTIQWKAHITSKKHKRVLQQKEKIKRMKLIEVASTKGEQETEPCEEETVTLNLEPPKGEEK